MKSKGHIILGSQLRKARETVQFPVEEVAEYLEIPQNEILAWETEQAKPSLGQLERLAEFYGREIDYFLKETPRLPAPIQLRSATQRQFKELSIKARSVIAKFDELCRTAFELEQTLNKPLLVKIERVPKDMPPVNLAWEQREFLELDGKPATKLRERLSNVGVRVFEIAVPEQQFSGLSFWHSVYGPCILVNAGELPRRRNFTLAHEYAHLLYSHQPSVCEHTEGRILTPVDDEQRANVFTVEFLLPEEPLRENFSRRHLSKTPSAQEIGRIAGKWCVSFQAMIYRLENLSLIERGYAQELLDSYQPSDRFRRSRVPQWRKRLGETYVSNALQAYHEGHISLGKLSHSLGIPLRKALDVAERHREKG